MLRIKLIKLLCGLKKKKKLFSHSSVYKAKNLANKQEELELLPDEHKFDLLGSVKEPGGKKSPDWNGKINGNILFKKN